MDRQKDGYIDKWIDIWIDRWINRWIDIWIDRQLGQIDILRNQYFTV